MAHTAYGLLDERIARHAISQRSDVAMFGRNLINKTDTAAATNVEAQGYNAAFPGNARLVGLKTRKTF